MKSKVQSAKCKVGGADDGSENGLPKGWVSESLMQIASVKTGKMDANHGCEQGHFPFFTCAFTPITCNTYSFEGPSIILPGNGANVGQVFYYNGKFEAYQRTYVISDCKVDPKYLYWHLKAFWEIRNRDQQYGSATNYIRITNFERYFVEYPSLDRQVQIVAKIEELFSDLDAGVESLKKAQVQLKVYRQSVLKAAFEGKLTAEWRAKQKKLPTAQELLATIQAERQAHYESKLKEWKTATTKWEKGGKVGKKPSKPSAPEEMVPLSKDELMEMPKLPEGWAWCRLGFLADVGTGATPLKSNKAYYEGGSIPWVTSGVANSLIVRESSDFITPKAVDETNATLFPIGTLLVAMYGEGKTRGMCTELAIDATTNQALAGITFNELHHDVKDFVKWFFLKNYEDLRRAASGGVQPNLNLSIIKNLLIPIPSRNEQTIIKNELDAVTTRIEKCVETMAMASSQSTSLRQSILKRAFEGKLV